MKFRNQEYYERVRNLPNESVRPFVSRSTCLISIFTALLSIAVAPFFTARKTHIAPTSLDMYVHQIIFFGCAVAMILLPLLWYTQVKPYLEMKDGHHYVGKFEIIKKSQVLGYCFLILFPGKRNWIKVNQRIFYSLRVGETIEVKRATLGDISDINKIRNIRQRIKGNYTKFRERMTNQVENGRRRVPNNN